MAWEEEREGGDRQKPGYALTLKSLVCSPTSQKTRKVPEHGF